jgi:hypothetical protein
VVELGGIEAPLLAGVAFEEGPVETAPDGRDHGVAGGRDLSDRLGESGEQPFRRRVVLQSHAQDLRERRAVDRPRHAPVAEVGEDAVFVGPPAGEARQIVDDSGALVWNMCGP